MNRKIIETHEVCEGNGEFEVCPTTKVYNLDFAYGKLRELTWGNINSCSLLDYDQEQLNTLLDSFTSHLLEINIGSGKIREGEQEYFKEKIKDFVINLVRKKYMRDFSDEYSNITTLLSNNWFFLERKFLSGGINKECLVEVMVNLSIKKYFYSIKNGDILYFSKAEIARGLLKLRRNIDILFQRLEEKQKKQEERKDIEKIKSSL